MSGVLLNGGPESPLLETVKLKPGLPCRPHDVGDARSIDICPGKVLMGGTSPRERRMLKLVKLERQSHQNCLTTDMELLSLKFALLSFSLVLVLYCFTVSSFLHFGLVMHILCHYILGVYYLFCFDFLFDGFAEGYN